MDKKSICAVVVTYNRKVLLLRCLQALEKQSYSLEHIVVVDNASTDGTVDFLRQHGYLDDSNVTLLNLTENQGGAGGFHAGIKFAYEQGYDYIWLMDDDGVPDNTCLKELVKFIKDDNYIGPLVLDIDHPLDLTFTLRLPKTNKVLSNLNDIKQFDQIIPDIVMPFNGILFSRNVVNKIGLPKKDYFIWGDDMEYTWRASKFDINIYTVISAKFFHPREKTLGTPMFFNMLKFNDTDSKIKLYCMCRNNIRNLIEYKGRLIALFFCFKVFWFYLFTKFNLSKLKIAIKGIIAGIKSNFIEHKYYLSEYE
ncbi:glycosyltransferase family 2 protein [Aggregatibacter kilianii]|uniref:glycosyltransferase family 2 protein n=1 Tax=Aggregatibacter kilianii TaxID=2025884 RepID=UPI000D64CD3A|nr:glycosyltransferase family 2 protein [Aggregatibacter kilianii]